MLFGEPCGLRGSVKAEAQRQLVASVSYRPLACLGRSAGGALSHQTILAVFGLWRIDERRVVARARYAFVFSQTQRRPWRKSIFAELQARVGRDPHFKKQSVTGAIGAALKKLGLAWPGAASVDSDDEEFGPFLRSRAEVEADAMQAE